jgi:hypothetical protein
MVLCVFAFFYRATAIHPPGTAVACFNKRPTVRRGTGQNDNLVFPSSLAVLACEKSRQPRALAPCCHAFWLPLKFDVRVRERPFVSAFVKATAIPIGRITRQ